MVVWEKVLKMLRRAGTYLLCPILTVIILKGLGEFQGNTVGEKHMFATRAKCHVRLMRKVAYLTVSPSTLMLITLFSVKFNL